MNRNNRGLPIVALFLLACSGCTIPTVENPLVAPADAKPLPSLHGVYRSTDCPDNLVNYAHIGPAGDGYPASFLRIVVVSQPKDQTALGFSSYIGFVEPIGKHHVLHIPWSKTEVPDEQRTNWNQNWEDDQVAGYMVMRLSVAPDDVEMSDLNDDFVEQQIAAKKIDGRVTRKAGERDDAEPGNKTITITADTDDLRKFFTRHIDGELFNESRWKFTRVK
ncbi:MAG: hypothetical protein WD066_13690 [Planctomycetaceae bacterium]